MILAHILPRSLCSDFPPVRDHNSDIYATTTVPMAFAQCPQLIRGTNKGSHSITHGSKVESISQNPSHNSALSVSTAKTMASHNLVSQSQQQLQWSLQQQQFQTCLYQNGFKVRLLRLGLDTPTVGHEEPLEGFTVATNQTSGTIKAHPQPHQHGFSNPQEPSNRSSPQFWTDFGSSAAQETLYKSLEQVCHPFALILGLPRIKKPSISHNRILEGVATLLEPLDLKNGALKQEQNKSSPNDTFCESADPLKSHPFTFTHQKTSVLTRSGGARVLGVFKGVLSLKRLALSHRKLI
eukprot:Gb_19519 [translate_table: standard]